MFYVFAILFIFISVCYGKIPSHNIEGLFEATKPEYREVSPLWSFVALDGGMLEAYRFYGNHTYSADAAGQRIDVVAKNDPIAQLIHMLFSSPDGETFVANTRKNDPVGFLSRHLENIDDITSILLSDNSKSRKSRIVDILRPKKEENFIYKKGVDDDFMTQTSAENFADVITGAHDYERKGRVFYPKNTAIIALNAFFIDVADHIKDLEKLKTLMKDGFTVDKDLRAFTDEDYQNNKPNLSEIIKDATDNPELAFLMFLGEEKAKGSLTLSPLPQRGDTKIILNGQESPAFPDCGEVALENFFLKISHFSASSLQIFLENIEKNNPEVLSYVPYLNLKTLVLDDQLFGHRTKESHSAWAQLVSGLNNMDQPLGFDDVAYKHETYEIRALSSIDRHMLGGAYNLINVIAKLIPDPVLLESWIDDKEVAPDPKELVKKLDKKLARLCNLVSPDLTHTLKGDHPYMGVVFSYDKEDFIEWVFTHKHFRLNVLLERPDWREPYYHAKFTNSWLGACFNRLTEAQSKIPLSISYIFNPSIRVQNDCNMSVLNYAYYHGVRNLRPIIAWY